jgi:hypothetical protein
VREKERLPLDAEDPFPTFLFVFGTLSRSPLPVCISAAAASSPSSSPLASNRGVVAKLEARERPVIATDSQFPLLRRAFPSSLSSLLSSTCKKSPKCRSGTSSDADIVPVESVMAVSSESVDAPPTLPEAPESELFCEDLRLEPFDFCCFLRVLLFVSRPFSSSDEREGHDEDAEDAESASVLLFLDSFETGINTGTES